MPSLSAPQSHEHSSLTLLNAWHTSKLLEISSNALDQMSLFQVLEYLSVANVEPQLL